MKIALLEPDIRNISDGDTIFVRLLKEHLTLRGHRVMPISFQPYSPTSLLFDSSWGEALERLRRFEPDIVLEDCRSYPLFSRMNHAIRSLAAAPVVSIVESLPQRDAAWGRWRKTRRCRPESDFFKSVDALVFTSRTGRNEAVRKYPQIGHSIVTYPAGNHLAGIGWPEKIVERARRCGPLQLLFRGDVLPGSGLIHLIRSLRSIPEGSWQLRIIGDDRLDRSYTKRITRMIDRKGFNGWIELMGQLQGDALEKCYAGSHALFTPFSSNRYETAVIEAMGYGLPAFCPATGASRELVQDGVNGFLISPENRDEVALKIGRLYSDRDRLVVMGLAAWSASQQHPKWADCFGAIEDLLFRAQNTRGAQPLSGSSTYPRNMVMLEN